MIKKRGFPRIFFGWWTVIAGGLLQLWGTGYQIYAMSAMFKPIASELGFSRAAASVAASIGRLEGGFEAPLTGWIIDRFGPRWVITFGIFLLGLGLILMNFVNSLWTFYIVWGVVAATGANMGLSLPIDKAISNWFVKKRGLATGFRWVFSGLAPVLVIPLATWLIITRGWRITAVIGGLVMWLVGLPLAWFFIKRHRPEYYGLLPDGATSKEETEPSQMIDKGVKYAAEVEEVEFTLRQALRTPAYWLLIVARSGPGMIVGAITLHSIPLLTDMGIDPVRAAAIISMTSAIRLPTRFIGGFIVDRVKKGHLRFLMAGAYCLLTIGFTIFRLNQTIATAYILFLLYFFGSAITIPLDALVRARYFGRKAFASISGISTMLMTPVGIAAPIYLGWVYDTTGSYANAFTLIAALLAFSAVLASLILPPKPPAQITDIHQFM